MAKTNDQPLYSEMDIDFELLLEKSPILLKLNDKKLFNDNLHFYRMINHNASGFAS